MPIRYIGPYCARAGCRWPQHHASLCLRCYRLARTVGKDPAVLAREPRLDADPAALAADLGYDVGEGFREAS